MSRGLRWAGVLLAGLGLAGLLVAWTGIVPIRASSGHWAITRWFLETAMERSVATHSTFVSDRHLDGDPDDPGLILKGAGHFANGCAPCHGAPGAPRPRVVRGMTPRPPDLSQAAVRWEVDELFYIVWHGVKFTGMPAWPSRERPDEAWAVAAFVRALPGMAPEEYRWLVQADPPPPSVGVADAPGVPVPREPERVPEAVRESCGRCHGAHGLGRGFGVFPKLRGQSPAYLYAALVAYARGERHSGVMEPVAAALDREAMRELARYYGGLEPLGEAGRAADGTPPGAPAPATGRGGEAPGEAGSGAGTELRRRGREIVRRGLPERKVPSCADCHGPGQVRRNPFYPELAGQYAEYLVLQLELFAQGRRGGSPYAHLMHEVAPHLEADERRAVALYYDALDPAEPDRTEARERGHDRR